MEATSFGADGIDDNLFKIKFKSDGKQNEGQ